MNEHHQARSAIGDRLRTGGEVSDDEFDALFALRWRRVSSDYWTPIDVASTAAEWLTETGIRRVVDVGSGMGKFCLVGALRTGAEFVGIEQRRTLVRVASHAARRLEVEGNVSFVHARASMSALLDFRAFYLFNPFGENLHPPWFQLDQTVELGDSRFQRDVALMQVVFCALPAGSRVVTYHGFGGTFPDSFRMIRERATGEGTLRLWVKETESNGGPRGTSVRGGPGRCKPAVALPTCGCTKTPSSST